jgi:Zn-finger nucleic acid-binding protein
MTLIDQRDYFRCEFCATFHFSEPAGASADGVKSLGEASERDCPVCQLALVEGLLDGSRVLHCERCRGVLLVGDEFRQIITKRRAERNGAPAEPVPLNPEELQRHIDCPACGKRMEVHPYYGPGNVVIDSCIRCRLIWLDHGEIATIVRAPGGKMRATVEEGECADEGAGAGRDEPTV